MGNDDQMRRLFESVEFAAEPPMRSRAAADVRRGRRYLRRRRFAAWAAGITGIGALITGVAVALPGAAPPTDFTARDTGEASGAAASSDSIGDGSGATTAPAADDSDAIGQFELGNPVTRQLLLDTAIRHFDPDRTHLPAETSNAGSGMDNGRFRISTKLDWTIPGESGMGMVQVAVTTPGFADGEYARQDIGNLIGCYAGGEAVADDETLHGCVEQTLPETGETVIVAESNPDLDLVLGVMYERADGSFTAVGVYDLFGNNSLEPVSAVDIDLDQAIAFVTDPNLQLDRDEAAAAAEDAERADAEAARAEEELDFSRTETLPAPASENMTPDEAQAAVAECVDTVPEWVGFQAVLGVRADDADQPASWVIAQDGDTRMLCTSGGASLFGTPEVKSSPHLRAPVDMKQSDFGLYASSVARVTVQTSGGPRQDAIMRDGYWFLPIADDHAGPVALRGYDDTGKLVYDSTTDDPGPDACYTGPDGEEITRSGADDDAAPEDCQRMVEWGH